MKKLSIVLVIHLTISSLLIAQPVKVPFDSEQWDKSNAEYSFQKYEGKDAMLLQSGFLYLKDLEFTNGTIELDINFSALRNFPGIAFRIHSVGNFEEFYVRPHQSGNPDANQYTPVFNGLAGWQLYHGEKYATAINYTFNQWHHLKIVVKGTKADIYFDDMDKPLLKVDELLHGIKTGSLGLRTFTNVHFANFQYTLDNADYPVAESSPSEINGMIHTWQLAKQVQSNDEFKDKMKLSSEDLGSLEWDTYEVESSGVLNISRYLQLKENQTTALVRLNIKSDRKQIKKLDLGYSDFVSVYANGQVLYSGATNFRSRDYRYLGTIGYFDSVFLPLKKGNNQIVFVVRENFGGWGIQAIMDDQQGVQIN